MRSTRYARHADRPLAAAAADLRLQARRATSPLAAAAARVPSRSRSASACDAQVGDDVARDRSAVARSICEATPFERRDRHLRQARRRSSAARTAAPAVERAGTPASTSSADERRRTRQRHDAESGAAERAARCREAAWKRDVQAGRGPPRSAASSSSGRARQTIASAPRRATLRGELGPLRRDQQRRQQADADRRRHAGRSAARDRLRVGDHEEEEDQHLGREHEHPPEVRARDRAEVPARGHLMAAEREHADARPRT